MAAEPHGSRHARGSGPRARIHGDRAAHGARLDSRARTLAAIHVERRATLGVDPKLVLVFELAGPVSLSSLRAAGLTVLGGTQGSAVVAFADDPQLHAFLARVQSYRAAKADVKYAPNEGFIDVLNEIRLYRAEDRITDRLHDRGQQTNVGEQLDVQIDL